jgi:hypothetical protein
MRILFDHGTPAPLRHALAGHAVSTAYEMSWTQLSNGALLKQADSQFDALITTDRNLRYRLAILVLPTTSWPKIRAQQAKILAAINALQPGAFVEVEFP